MKIKFLKILIALFVFLSSFNVLAEENDFLYSQEYFDYLIDCADFARQEELENQKIEQIVLEKKQQKEQKQIEKQEKQLAKELKKQEKQMSDLEITQDELHDEIVANDTVPFKLKIESNALSKYTESYKTEDSKAIIPLTKKLSAIQDTVTWKNKYNSADYRFLTGLEYGFNKYFKLTSGVETNLRGLDQNPISRKLYITPTLTFNDRFSLKFYNKMNIATKSMDHDLGLNFSPLKSKAVDFGVYAGLTREQSGSVSESVSLKSSFYF